MSRYCKQFVLPMGTEQAVGIIQSFMTQNGFEPYDQKGEPCWKKGHGILTAPQIIKTTVCGGIITVEAWIRFAILPGVYCGEMGLTGFWGFAIKDALKSKVQALESMLGFVPGVTPVFAPGTAPDQGYAPAPNQGCAPAPNQNTDGTVCPNCGAVSGPSDNFCQACGTAVKQTSIHQ
jgi:hypothetical protein